MAALVEETALLVLERALEDALEPSAVEETTALPLALPVGDVTKSTKLVEAAEVAGIEELAVTEEPDFVDDEAVCTRDPEADLEAAADEALEEAVLSVLEPAKLELLNWVAAILEPPIAALELEAMAEEEGCTD